MDPIRQLAPKQFPRRRPHVLIPRRKDDGKMMGNGLHEDHSSME